MKLPYRRGDIFALPLGDGRFASSCIAHCEHRIVTICVTNVTGERFVVRVSDDALIERRWKPSACDPAVSRAVPENAQWMPSAHAERLAAARAGIAAARAGTLRVFEFSSTAPLPPAFERDDITYALAEPLPGALLETLCARVAPNLRIRLSPASFAHLKALLEAGLQRATVTATGAPFPASEVLADLTVVGRPDLEAIAEAFPSLETLALIARGDVDLTPLARCTRLKTLAISGAAVRGAVPAVRALKLVRVSAVARLDAIVTPVLRSLTVDRVHDLARLDGLGSCGQLEQLELRGLWQFDLRDAAFALELPNLVRAEIDIGGRRKNVELYRRAAWAYPWPFPGTLDP